MSCWRCASSCRGRTSSISARLGSRVARRAGAIAGEPPRPARVPRSLLMICRRHALSHAMARCRELRGVLDRPRRRRGRPADLSTAVQMAETAAAPAPGPRACHGGRRPSSRSASCCLNLPLVLIVLVPLSDRPCRGGRPMRSEPAARWSRCSCNLPCCRSSPSAAPAPWCRRCSARWWISGAG